MSRGSIAAAREQCVSVCTHDDGGSKSGSIVDAEKRTVELAKLWGVRGGSPEPDARFDSVRVRFQACCLCSSAGPLFARSRFKE